MLQGIMGTLINIGVVTHGAGTVRELTKDLGVLKDTLSSMTKVGLEKGMKNILTPPGMDQGALFRIARGINTIAANIRFLQITLMMFIGGNLIKGFLDLFINLNADIQASFLSLKAIIESQKEVEFADKFKIPIGGILPPEGMKQMKAAIDKDTKTLVDYATSQAIKMGGEIPDMIQTARGIQVNTKEIGSTMRLMSTASQLALLDPQQGLKGAAFVIRELMQGQGPRDFRSMAQRFELSFSMEFKKKFGDSVKKGNISQALDLLDEEFKKKGITDKILKNLEKSWILSVNVIKGNMALAFTKIGEPLFNFWNKELFKMSKFFVHGQGLNFENMPEFKIIKASLGTMLLDYVGVPLRDSFIEAKNYLLGFFTDPENFAFIDKNIVSQIFNSGKQFIGFIKFIADELFKSLGTSDKNGDTFKGFINTIGFIVTGLTGFLKEIVKDKAFVGTIKEHIKAWSDYIKIMISPENIRATILWSNMALQWQTFILNFQSGMIKLLNFLSPFVSFINSILYILSSTIMGVVTMVMELSTSIMNLITHVTKYITSGTYRDYLAKIEKENPNPNPSEQFNPALMKVIFGENPFSSTNSYFSNAASAFNSASDDIATNIKNTFSTNLAQKDLLTQNLSAKERQELLNIIKIQSDTQEDMLKVLKDNGIKSEKIEKAVKDYMRSNERQNAINNSMNITTGLYE